MKHLWIITVLAFSVSQWPALSVGATVYWDPDGTGASGNPPTSGVGGTGTWDTVSSQWWNGSTYQSWADNDDADFRVSNGGGSRLVFLDETIQVRSITDNIRMIFQDSGANALDFSAAAGSFSRNVNQSVTLSTRIIATSGFTFDSTEDNGSTIGMGGTPDVNEFSGTLNVFTHIATYRDNALGGAGGTAAHLNMDDSGLISLQNSGNDSTFASITGSSGSRIYRSGTADGSITLTGAGLSSSSVRTFSGTLDNVTPASDGEILVTKQGSYIQTFNGSDKVTAGIDIQDGTMRFDGGVIEAPDLTLSDTAISEMDGGIVQVDNLTFSPSGGIMDFDGGTLALQGVWDLTSLTGIANSTFTVQGVDSEEARSAMKFTSGTGDYAGYTMIDGGVVPEPGSMALIAFGTAALLFFRRQMNVA